ncbi:hypothetical protein JOQ06_001508 [Pogonophryne albipinna]|uniref:Uncharacterized protein n=1 Tax=Pogonophryne albipinna TaxID=1090488 RepID=A0AAD6FJ72_9TELE|nr:hypothetical protein JOQ06_001508 [Pogonophryne albipinna]
MPDLGQASQPESLQVCSLTSTWDRVCYLSTLFSLAGRPTLCLPYYGNHESHGLVINESSYRAEHNDSNQSQKAEGLSTNQKISSPPPTMLALQIASECWGIPSAQAFLHPVQ